MLPALGLQWTKSAILWSRLFHTADHFNVNRFTVPSLLKDCARNLDIEQSKRIHAAIIHLTLHSDPFIASSLITLYSKCGKLLYADHVFGQLLHRDTSVWNSIISGYFVQHRSKDGLSLLRQMQLAGFRPDRHSVTILLGACSDGQLDLEHGKQVHGFLVRTELEDDNFTLTALIHMYSRTNQITRARKVFDGISDKSASMWNAIISGYGYNGLWEKSLEIFVLLTGEDFEVHSETVSAVLAACAKGGATEFARGVHCCAIKMAFELNSSVCTSLITIYSSAGDMDGAFRIFHAANNKEVQLWNSMLSAFVSSSFFPEAMDYYDRMRSVGINPDSITITIVLSACNAIGQWEFGLKTHGLLIKRPEFNTSGIQSSLISMYMKIGDVKCATILFSSFNEPDVVILSSMITGFFQNRKYDLALQKFKEFRSEGFILDSGIVAAIVCTCTAIDLLHLGCQIHSFSIKNGTSSDAYVGSSLINMYSKCGLLLSAESVFFTVTEKNVVVWNSLISAYSRSSLLSKAIFTFAGIAQSGLFPDSISLTSVLISVSACAALSYGKMIHGYQLRNGISCDELLENSLIDMYMKCGCLRNAQLLFRRMAVRNTVTWNTMIAGYGFLGHCLRAIDLFDEMQKLKISPDGTTFLSLISSCSHCMLVEQGQRLYNSMITEYDIMPTMEHYANMVDLFSRAGCLDEAYCFIKAMPLEPSESIWLCFLSACKSYRASYLGEIASHHLLKLNPQGSGSYTQVTNFYGQLGLLEQAASVRHRMKEAGLLKNPGCSWVEVMGRFQLFYSGDLSLPLTKDVHASLQTLQRTMKLTEEFIA